MTVVGVGAHRPTRLRHRAQSVAIVERVQHAVLVRQVALYVVAHADDAGPGAAPRLDVGQALVGVVAVVVVACSRAADRHAGHVVEGVVGVGGGAEHLRRRDRLQTIQPVVGHVAVTDVAAQRIGNRRNVAVGVVVVAVIDDRHRPSRIATAIRHPAQVLPHLVRFAIAEREALHRVVRVVEHVRCVAADCRRPPQCIRRIGDRERVGVRLAGQVAVRRVLVHQAPHLPAGLQGFRREHPPLVVGVARGDHVAIAVVGGERLQLAVGRVGVAGIAAAIRERQRCHAVALVVRTGGATRQQVGVVRIGAAVGLPRQPARGPGQVARGVVAQRRGHRFQFGAVAQFLLGVVAEVTSLPGAVGAGAQEGQGLAERIALDAGGGAFGMCDDVRVVLRRGVPRVVAGRGLVAALVGEAGREVGEVLGRRQQDAEFGILRDLR